MDFLLSISLKTNLTKGPLKNAPINMLTNTGSAPGETRLQGIFALPCESVGKEGLEAHQPSKAHGFVAC